jgi:hypothetical protein
MFGGCGAVFGGCGAFTGFGGCGAFDSTVEERVVSSVPAGIPERDRICSTMLLPNSVKARCATVSPTERAMAAVTAD